MNSNKKLMDSISHKTGISKFQAALAIASLLNVIIEEMKKENGKITIYKLGSFQKKKNRPKMIYNFSTGEKQLSTKKHHLYFKASSSLIKAINP